MQGHTTAAAAAVVHGFPPDTELQRIRQFFEHRLLDTGVQCDLDVIYPVTNCSALGDVDPNTPVAILLSSDSNAMDQLVKMGFTDVKVEPLQEHVFSKVSATIGEYFWRRFPHREEVFKLLADLQESFYVHVKHEAGGKAVTITGLSFQIELAQRRLEGLCRRPERGVDSRAIQSYHHVGSRIAAAGRYMHRPTSSLPEAGMKRHMQVSEELAEETNAAQRKITPSDREAMVVQANDMVTYSGEISSMSTTDTLGCAGDSFRLDNNQRMRASTSETISFGPETSALMEGATSLASVEMPENGLPRSRRGSGSPMEDDWNKGASESETSALMEEATALGFVSVSMPENGMTGPGRVSGMSFGHSITDDRRQGTMESETTAFGQERTTVVEDATALGPVPLSMAENRTRPSGSGSGSGLSSGMSGRHRREKGKAGGSEQGVDEPSMLHTQADDGEQQQAKVEKGSIPRRPRHHYPQTSGLEATGYSMNSIKGDNNLQQASYSAAVRHNMQEPYENMRTAKKTDCVAYKSNVSDHLVHIYEKDVTTLSGIDAIVNSTNSSLILTINRLAKSISNTAGPTVEDECWGFMKKANYVSVPETKVVVTTGGKLCHKIIHAVTPQRRSTTTYEQAGRDLLATFSNCLNAAENEGMQNIAIPAICAGMGTYSKKLVSEMLYEAVSTFCKKSYSYGALKTIHLVDLDRTQTHETEACFKQSTDFTLIPGADFLGPPQTGSYSSPSLSQGGAPSSSVSPSTARPDRIPGGAALLGPPQTGSYSSPSFSQGGAHSASVTSPSTARPEAEVDLGANSQDECPICLEVPKTNETRSLKCGHTFCKECIAKSLEIKKVCPVCGAILGKLTGNQPRDGQMKSSVSKFPSLQGYEKHGTIQIDYYFPGGIQTDEHSNPGKRYHGTARTAYLPNNKKGKEVLALLKRAFDARLTFTIGRSVTTGLNDQVTWNDIHHKTSSTGGSFGYPDPTYLDRVKEELAAKGIK